MRDVHWWDSSNCFDPSSNSVPQLLLMPQSNWRYHFHERQDSLSFEIALLLLLYKPLEDGFSEAICLLVSMRPLTAVRYFYTVTPMVSRFLTVIKCLAKDITQEPQRWPTLATSYSSCPRCLIIISWRRYYKSHLSYSYIVVYCLWYCRTISCHLHLYLTFAQIW